VAIFAELSITCPRFAQLGMALIISVMFHLNPIRILTCESRAINLYY
jgi:hypothetical protein